MSWNLDWIKHEHDYHCAYWQDIRLNVGLNKDKRTWWCALEQSNENGYYYTITDEAYAPTLHEAKLTALMKLRDEVITIRLNGYRKRQAQLEKQLNALDAYLMEHRMGVRTKT